MSGVTPRKGDKLIWERIDLSGDGTGPSAVGYRKVGEILLDFFKNDPTTKPRFLQHSTQNAGSTIN